jgi:ribonuclease R
MMITKEELLEYMWQDSYKPVSAEELWDRLRQKNYPLEDRAVFLMLLQELEEAGKIVLNRKGRYGLPQKMNLVVGRIQGSAKGFAFVIPDDVQTQDVYVSSEDLHGAMHNDRVIIRLHRHLEDGRKPEGEVIRILERANKQLVGTYESSRYFGFVTPDEKRLGTDVFIPKNEAGGAKAGDKVVVEITAWAESRRNPEGRVLEVLGNKDQPGIDILSIVRKYQLPEAFPAEVLAEAERIPETVAEAEKAGRRDLRNLPMVTIDGEDAKDLDDAVTLEQLPNGNYYLGVHIADVGYYVREGSLLDEEALKRATSVYLVDRVIPMLPPRLSNGICSLNAGEDRLAMSCLMEIDGDGEVVRHEIVPTVIRVKERMTYTAVRKILEDQEPEFGERYRSYVPIFELMRDLCLILRQKRLRRGAIDFDFPESKVILNEQGKPVEIVPRERSIAEMIIEEFMIAANETVAEEFFWREVPFLYRVHERPDLDDLTELNEFLGVFGYYIKANRQGEVSPRAYQQVLEKTAGRPEERTIAMVMLRSMKHARYAPEALGHFGLAAKYYSHFTSPIRRYPDLAIHRVIREIQEGAQAGTQAREQAGEKTRGLVAKRRKKLGALMEEYAEQSSLRERVAEDAERESVDLKKVEYMRDFVGQVFTGVISGVTSFGFFVELPNTVEGLVHVSTLTDDYYIYVEKQLMLVGESTNNVYRIGDTVKVLLTRVNVEERNIDFEIVPEEKPKKGKRRK